MGLYYDLPVFKDAYKLIMKIFDYTKDFPKEFKYTLGTQHNLEIWIWIWCTKRQKGRMYNKSANWN